MKRLILPLLLLAACNASEPSPQPAPEAQTHSPDAPAPATQTPAPEPEAEVSPTSPEAAVIAARRYFDDQAVDERYSSYAVELGEPGRMEGAAGSIYIEIPARVTATLDSGETQRLGGTVVLRRVNGVPGSTAEQRRWHVENVDLKPVE